MQLSNITMTKRPEFSYFVAIWSHCDHIVEKMWSLILGVITVRGCDHTVITPLSKMITNFSVITGVITCFSLWPQNIFNGGTSIPLPLNSNFNSSTLKTTPLLVSPLWLHYVLLKAPAEREKTPKHHLVSTTQALVCHLPSLNYFNQLESKHF